MSAESALYLDSSALVKLVSVEWESAALRHSLVGRSRLVTSVLSSVEVMRAAHRAGTDRFSRARTVLARVAKVPVGAAIVDRAGSLLPGSSLRSLDAIHLASALLIPDLTQIVTYDNRMAAAAAELGLVVLAPA